MRAAQQPHQLQPPQPQPRPGPQPTAFTPGPPNASAADQALQLASSSSGLEMAAQPGSPSSETAFLEVISEPTEALESGIEMLVPQ